MDTPEAEELGMRMKRYCCFRNTLVMYTECVCICTAPAASCARVLELC